MAVSIQTIDLGNLHQLNVILDQSASCTDEKCDVAVFCAHMTLEVQSQMQAFARVAAILARKTNLLPQSAEVLGRPALVLSETLHASSNLEYIRSTECSQRRGVLG